MQNFNLIAQSVLKLSHCEKVHNNDNDNDDDDNDDDDTHPGWIIVRDGKKFCAAIENNVPLRFP